MKNFTDQEIRTCKGKIRHKSEDVANAFYIKFKEKKKIQDNSPSNAYHCAICDGFHLTSKPKNYIKVVKLAHSNKGMIDREAEHWINKNKWD